MHEAVLKAYQEADYEYIDTSQDMLERNFWREVLKDDGTPYAPLIYNTVRIVRIKIGGKEYMTYDERITGQNFVGNEMQLTLLKGKYSKPIFKREFDPRSRKVIGKEITRHEVVYEIEFDRAKIEDLLTRNVDNEAHFYVYVPGGRRYSIMSAEDFLEGTYDELVRMGKEGKTLSEIRTPAAIALQQQIPPSKRIGTAAADK